MKKKRKLVIKNRLRQLLKERGMTQQQLSSMTGISQTQLSRIVTNAGSVINVDHMALIAEKLGIEKIEELIQLLKL